MKSKKGFYQISDPFLRLWFGAIYPYESFLEFDQIVLIEKRLEPLIQQHIAHCYEKICRNFVMLTPGAFGCHRVGRQWGKNYEIDVAGVNRKNRLTLIGECTWSRNQVGLSVLRSLQKKVTDNKLPASPTCKYILFSKSGFSTELQQHVETNENIILIRSLFSGMRPL